jgi:hypothetical protein
LDFAREQPFIHHAAGQPAPFIDSKPFAPILGYVIRLVVSLLSALALALSPISVNAASVGQGPMAGCDMHQKMPAKPANHGKVDCCTPACPAASPTSLATQCDASSDGAARGSELHARYVANKPDSFAPTGLDPPPRLIS